MEKKPDHKELEEKIIILKRLFKDKKKMKLSCIKELLSWNKLKNSIMP